MDIFKLLILTILFLMLLQLLREHCSPFAVLASAAACIVILFITLKVSAPIFVFAGKLSSLINNDSLKCVMKCIAIAILTQMTQELCGESGQLALAGRVELAGKISILICALPMFTELLNIISGILL
ncbi:MAG: stage III sporulation AC/AD family protein [Oscillospiraceae bacterium]